mmetsp:Transcript_15426/g.33411  ORF Transcript_15426/g.33411 Transcript_15426/m.33411 type:complete len:275 (+) Transcript_15426:478-1302(+)
MILRGNMRMHCSSSGSMLGMHTICHGGHAIGRLRIHHCHGGSLLLLWHSIGRVRWRRRLTLRMSPLPSCRRGGVVAGSPGRRRGVVRRGRGHARRGRSRRVTRELRGARQRVLKIVRVLSPRRGGAVVRHCRMMHLHPGVSGRRRHPGRRRCKVRMHHLMSTTGTCGVLVSTTVPRGNLRHGVLGNHHWHHHHDLLLRLLFPATMQPHRLVMRHHPPQLLILLLQLAIHPPTIPQFLIATTSYNTELGQLGNGPGYEVYAVGGVECCWEGTVRF